MEPSPAASSSAAPARSGIRPLVVPPGAGRQGAERTESGGDRARRDPGARAAGRETWVSAPRAWRPLLPAESPSRALGPCRLPRHPWRGSQLSRAGEPCTRPRGQIQRPGSRGSGPPRWGGGRGGRRSPLSLSLSLSLSRAGAGPAQGIKAARAGAQASSGVVLGRVLAPESHDQATATSLLTKRLGVQCSDQSIMPNFSGSWKIIRSENFEDLLKVLGKEIFGRPGPRGGHGKERRAGIRAGEVGRQRPRARGPSAWPGSGGSGPGPKGPERPACGSSRKHEVGVPGVGQGSPSETLPPLRPWPPRGGQ